METTYVSFGQVHKHTIDGKRLDKDTIAKITHSSHENGADIAYRLFKNKYSQEFSQEAWSDDMLRHFPKGLVDISA